MSFCVCKGQGVRVLKSLRSAVFGVSSILIVAAAPALADQSDQYEVLFQPRTDITKIEQTASEPSREAARKTVKARARSHEAAVARAEAARDKAPVEAERGKVVKNGRALGYVHASRERYRDLIAKHAKAHGLPFALVDAVVRVESRYNPRAYNGGAYGLMQIKHQTARGLGYGGSAAGLYDPDTNLRYAVKYLAQAYQMSGGDTCATVMRYQSGHYAKRMNGANRAYCSKVRTIVASLGSQES
ncbi:lytic transglycosylase domain-containing protein [Chelatococcus daeguensis]|nr:lytic transglycosylase domain-containing protein [Chelatococcus daeguensis]